MQRLTIVSLALAAIAPQLVSQQPKPPVAQQIARVDTLHGDVLTDNYFWLREKTNPKVLAYLDSENAYTAAAMHHTEALQDKLYHEMLGRIRETDLTVPYRENGYRHLMQALARTGNTAEALRVYEQLRTLLGDELGAIPSAETLAHDHLIQHLRSFDMVAIELEGRRLEAVHYCFGRGSSVVLRERRLRGGYAGSEAGVETSELDG